MSLWEMALPVILGQHKLSRRGKKERRNKSKSHFYFCPQSSVTKGKFGATQWALGRWCKLQVPLPCRDSPEPKVFNMMVMVVGNLVPCYFPFS